jgi:uncharacterized protein
MTTDTVLPVADLIGRPGASRRVDLALPVPEDLDLPLATVIPPIRLTGEVANVVEGVLVRGVLDVDMQLQCARCLEDMATRITVEVVELFRDPLRGAGAPTIESRKQEFSAEDVVEKGYEITHDNIDLDTLLRDNVASAVPWQPLCGTDCKGLCAVCGANRNEVECSCAETTTDPRWAALENLDLKADGA